MNSSILIINFLLNAFSFKVDSREMEIISAAVTAE